MLLLLADELLVNLFRSFDSVGGLLGGVPGVVRLAGLLWGGFGCVCGGGIGLESAAGSEAAGATPTGRLGLVSVVHTEGARGADARGRGAAIARGEDELQDTVLGGFDEEDVGGGAVEQGGEDGLRSVGTVGSVDALVRDSAGDLHASCSSDVSEYLGEGGVVCGDGE